MELKFIKSRHSKVAENGHFEKTSFSCNSTFFFFSISASKASFDFGEVAFLMRLLYILK